MRNRWKRCDVSALKSFYGDATRLDLLRTAGAERARIFIIAIDNEDKALELVDLVQENFPQLRILARAASRQHAYELLRRGRDRSVSGNIWERA